MPLSAQILAGIAALIHVFFFYLESVAWTKPSTWKTFGMKSQEEAEVTKGLALNQGYYNLFLAIGVFVGIGLYRSVDEAAWTTYAPLEGEENVSPGFGFDGQELYWGEAFVVFGLAVMLGAALVLLISSKGKMLRGAAIQGLAPLAALIIIAATDYTY